MREILGTRLPSSTTKHNGKMEESTLENEQDSKSHGVSDLIAEQENDVVKFDIGSFVLCHRKLFQLIEPFVKCYESFHFVTRWQSQRQSFVVMLISVYLSIKYPVYLLLIPLVYAVLVLSLAAVKKLGSRNSKSSLNLRRNKFKRKEEDVVNLELKLAAMKQAQLDLRAYINISIQIQTFEENVCEYLEQFYRICRWEDTFLSKACLLALSLAIFILFFLPGKYLVTMGIVGAFTGNADFKEVFRRTTSQFQLTLEQWKQTIYSQTIRSSRSFQKSLIPGVDADNDYDDEWYDAEQESSQSESESESGSFDEENDAEEDEDTPTRKRRARLFSGLSMVTHFSDYRKKQKRINSGNCASCDVSFSSLLKKRQYCRHCGDSFCSRCCSKRVKRAVFGATAPAAYEETVLVCKSCYGYLMNKADEMNTDIW